MPQSVFPHQTYRQCMNYSPYQCLNVILCVASVIRSVSRFHVATPVASMRKFASMLGLRDEEERVFVVACPRRLADVTVLREVT